MDKKLKARVVYTPRDTIQPYSVWMDDIIDSFHEAIETAFARMKEINGKGKKK